MTKVDSSRRLQVIWIEFECVRTVLSCRLFLLFYLCVDFRSPFSARAGVVRCICVVCFLLNIHSLTPPHQLAPTSERGESLCGRRTCSLVLQCGSQACNCTRQPGIPRLTTRVRSEIVPLNRPFFAAWPRYLRASNGVEALPLTLRTVPHKNWDRTQGVRNHDPP